jgi:hypothetical protein
MLAIMGRMAAYTGKDVTWEQAMNSTEVLMPETVEFGSRPVAPVAILRIAVLPLATVLALATLLKGAVGPGLALALIGLTLLPLAAEGRTVEEGLRLVRGGGGRLLGLLAAERGLAIGLGLAAEGRLSLGETLGRRGETVGKPAHVVVIVHFLHIGLAGRALIAHLGLRLRQLRRSDQAEVMFGVLEIAFRHHRVAGALGVAGELKIFLGHMMSSPTDFHIRTIRLIGAGERIGTLAVVATAHALILTWSHRRSLGASSGLALASPAGLSPSADHWRNRAPGEP